MKKVFTRSLSIFLTLAMVFSMGVIGFTASAVDTQKVFENGSFRYTLDTDGNASIVAYLPTAGTLPTSITIPGVLDGHTVVGFDIGEYSAVALKNVEEITFAPTIDFDDIIELFSMGTICLTSLKKINYAKPYFSCVNGEVIITFSEEFFSDINGEESVDDDYYNNLKAQYLNDKVLFALLNGYDKNYYYITESIDRIFPYALMTCSIPVHLDARCATTAGLFDMMMMDVLSEFSDTAAVINEIDAATPGWATTIQSISQILSKETIMESEMLFIENSLSSMMDSEAFAVANEIYYLLPNICGETIPAFVSVIEKANEISLAMMINSILRRENADGSYTIITKYFGYLPLLVGILNDEELVDGLLNFVKDAAMLGYDDSDILTEIEKIPEYKKIKPIVDYVKEVKAFIEINTIDGTTYANKVVESLAKKYGVDVGTVSADIDEEELILTILNIGIVACKDVSIPYYVDGCAFFGVSVNRNLMESATSYSDLATIIDSVGKGIYQSDPFFSTTIGSLINNYLDNLVPKVLALYMGVFTSADDADIADFFGLISELEDGGYVAIDNYGYIDKTYKFDSLSEDVKARFNAGEKALESAYMNILLDFYSKSSSVVLKEFLDISFSKILDCEEVHPTDPSAITKVIKDLTTGVAMEYPQSEYDGQTVNIQVEPMDDSPAFAIIDSYFNNVKMEAFDICMTIDGTDAQPVSPVKVSIPLPVGFNPTSTSILHIDPATGALSKIYYTIENNNLVFYINHFSYFIVVEGQQIDCEVIFEKSELKYKETTTVTLDGAILPVGTSFVVESSDTNIVRVVSCIDGKAVIKAVGDGTATITAKIVDANNNVISENNEELVFTAQIKCTMTFWQKIIKWIKNLFGIADAVIAMSYSA